ncbi:MAG: hypothetical protein HY342_05945 [Candidatus Lambdaproteobacteria bacterium]|nr:hypothetical protein [Candidatus Lambdaproteobacteria bacterium]
MRFVVLASIAYVVSLGVSWALPLVGMLDRQPFDGIDMVLYFLAILVQVASVVLLTLVIARVIFPEYWWRGQVLGQDIFEIDGVFFTGLRVARVPSRLQRIVFGVGERQRRWDLLFGVLSLVLLALHVMSVLAAGRVYSAWLPPRPKLPETLHYAVLSSFPVLKEFPGGWHPGTAVETWAAQQYEKLSEESAPDNETNYRMAQLALIQAFQEREKANQPFRYSPADRIFFNRGVGTAALRHLEDILHQPPAQQGDYHGAALALMGFFHIADQNFAKADDVLEQARTAIESGKDSVMSPYQVLLMQAHAAMMSGDASRAGHLLEKIVLNDRIPGREYALAMEHYAEALRLDGNIARVKDILFKALELYNMQEDRAGIARVYLRMAALAMEEGRYTDAHRDLSLASSNAHGMRDWFTLNMVGLLSQYFPAAG